MDKEQIRELKEIGEAADTFLRTYNETRGDDLLDELNCIWGKIGEICRALTGGDKSESNRPMVDDSDWETAFTVSLKEGQPIIDAIPPGFTSEESQLMRVQLKSRRS